MESGGNEMNKRVTIKDVAAKARVTHPTVSRALSDSPRVSEATKKRIRKIAAQLGYRPNLIARSLVRKQSRVVAVITPDLNPHVQPILRGVADACRRSNYALMLLSTDYWTEEGLSYMWVLDNWRVDGIIIYNVLYQRAAARDLQRLQCERVPSVFINKYLHDRKTNNVSVDNFDAVLRAMTHLHDLGHRRIGIMNGQAMSVDGVERFDGFRKALTKLGLPLEKHFVGCGNYSEEQAFEEMTRILCLRPRPTAMFCANDLMAMGVIRAAQKKGLKVPRDLAVVGFDDIESGQYFSPSLTTLRPPLRETGERAVALLMSLLENPRRAPEQIAMKAKLIVRQSSGTLNRP